MAVEWPVTSLEEAGVRLIDCLHKTPPDTGVGFPYIAIPQMKGGRIDLRGVRRISADAFREWTQKANPEPHDVLMSRRCNPGATAHVPPGLRFAVGQNLVLLRADGSKVYPPFLRWWTSSPAWWNEVRRFINVGAVFDSLRCADVPKFELPLPPLPEQRAIAHILGSLDDKIELNRKMNRTLEAMARAIFKSWFVDFDPVRAKAEGRQPPGMDAETAALFPDGFEDSELGPIPRGWVVGSIADVAVNYRETVKPDDVSDGTTYIGLEHVPRKSAALESWGSKEQVTSAKARFREGDILFGKLRPYFHKVVPAPTDGVCSTDILVIRPRTDDSRWYVFGHLSSDEMIAHATALSSGTRMPRTKWQDLCRFPIALPTNDAMGAFHAVVDPMFTRLRLNIAESRTLAALRDTLLPKLVSGELRVPDPERFLQEVAP